MPGRRRASNEEIVSAYRETGSVWKAARLLGIVGQSVWERLRAIGHRLPKEKWSAEEVGALRAMAGTMPIGKIAESLGRPYAAAACKLSELGLSGRTAKNQVRPEVGIDIAEMMTAAEADPATITKFCRSRGVNIDTFVLAAQKAFPDRWAAYVAARSSYAPKACAYCEKEFVPTSGKQRTCSRRCQGAKRTDDAYFGGKRRSTVGLAEGVCQLCRKRHKALSSHHALGKENDPGNDNLIALCMGCHRTVGILAACDYLGTEDGWESLISLVLLRRAAQQFPGKAGVHVVVDIETLDEEDMEAYELTTIGVKS